MKPLRCPSPVRNFALAVLAACSIACAEAAPDLAASLEDAGACGADQLTPCDILDRACQQRIAEIAACQWGGPGTPALLPEISLVAAEEYRTRRSATSASGDTATLTAADEALALLGLIDAGDLSVEATLNRNTTLTQAYYDFETKTITLIDHGAAVDPVRADATLLHELIHAQQDAAHDLASLQRSAEDSLDHISALRGLYEGEAEFHESLFENGLLHLQPSSEQIELNLRREAELAETAVFMGPSVLSRSMLVLPYTYGPAWIHELWVEGGSAVVQDQYADPPSHLLGVLQAVWGGGRHEAPSLLPYPSNNVFYRGLPPAADSELLPLGFDRLGAYAVYVAARLAGDSATGKELALGWRGDQLDVYELDAGGTAGRWQVRFDTAARASAFSNLMAQSVDVSVRQQGVSVVCVVSRSGHRPEWLFGPLGVL